METIATEVEEVLDALPAVRASQAIIARDEITVAEVVAQRDKVLAVMEAVMREGTHYGKIPGISKPTLLKPGAETINVALRLAPHYESEKIWHEDGHLTVSARCTLRHIPTDLVIATGEGLCTSREQKYAYRNQSRQCPVCKAEAIIKGKAEYGGGWLCWKKQDGCGAKFTDGDPAIEEQQVGKIPNPDLPDTFNTVLKMADKRALVAAVLNGTAASDVFTQDVEDSTSTPAEEMPREPTVDTPVGGPAPLQKPKSWAKLTEMVSQWNEWEHDCFVKFTAQAAKYLYGVDTSADLTPAQKKELLSTAGDAALELRRKFDPSLFPPPGTDGIRAAWASVLEGVELELPPEPVLEADAK